MSTADHVTCCCAETLADIERLTQERDDARDTACRLEAELACPGYLTDLDAMPDNARDLADELLTLQPVDPAHCNPRRKAHPVIGGRELECSECWRERVTERLEQWRRDIVSSRPGPLKPAQAPSVGLDAPHPGATAPGGAFPGDAEAAVEAQTCSSCWQPIVDGKSYPATKGDRVNCPTCHTRRVMGW